ncbi:MAG: ParB/RepB/Spo0J family partition protein [Planctomycetota bacterium]
MGRGLDSLIPALASEFTEGAKAEEIPLERLELNPKQPRFDVDLEELERLADSIRASGVIQPVVVRPAESSVGGYELVVGERRVRAAKLAGLAAVPALVRDVPDDKMLELALVENIQRSDLNPIEKAMAVRRMISELELTQEEAGRRLGLERSTVANMLRLLELSDELQQMVSRGTLSAGHARALLAIDREGVRARLARKIAAKGLSVRAAERLAAAEAGARGARRLREPSPNIVQLEEALSRALGARVEIKHRRKQGGKIVVSFSSHDDFERLYELLTGSSATEYPDKIPA